MKNNRMSFVAGLLVGLAFAFTSTGIFWRHMASKRESAIAETAANQAIELVGNFVTSDGSPLTQEQMQRRSAGLYSTQIVIASQQLPRMSQNTRMRLANAVRLARKVPSLQRISSEDARKAEERVLQ